MGGRGSEWLRGAELRAGLNHNTNEGEKKVEWGEN